ncbi:rRNA pseudouridine synthase [Candidatus Saccharibacteria bacterium]|nr:rRNA pseudouridine synthase [Candidatus Saccharibacteria bacterium]
MDNPQPSIRLNKFLAERLGVSRREADELIRLGQISVDGKTAILGTKVDSTSNIFYNKKQLPFDVKYTYIAFHKPVGYVCSRRAQGSTPTLYELLPAEYQHLKTVGRLDKDSSGLILLTNDGDFAFQMTHPKFRKTKVYEVELNKPLEPLHQQMISDYGVMLDDGPSKFKVIRDDFAKPLPRGIRSCYEDAATIPVKTGARSVPKKMVSRNQYIVTLSEGRNRQIRRTFAALGYRVTKLHRTSFGKYELGDLKAGEATEITL